LYENDSSSKALHIIIIIIITLIFSDLPCSLQGYDDDNDNDESYKTQFEEFAPRKQVARAESEPVLAIDHYFLFFTYSKGTQDTQG
jgi:hypothetical protein